MPSRLKEGEGLIRLAPAIVSATWITFDILGIEVVLRLRGVWIKEHRAETDCWYEGVRRRLCIGDGQRSLTIVCFFARHDKTILTIRIAIQLDLTEHFLHNGKLSSLKVMRIPASRSALPPSYCYGRLTPWCPGTGYHRRASYRTSSEQV